jgi:hypothetical protein
MFNSVLPGILVDHHRAIKPPEWVTNEDAQLRPEGIVSVRSPLSHRLIFDDNQ